MIISIDIGIKNLAFCAMTCKDSKDISSYEIEYWNVINTIEDDSEKLCKSIQKNGKTCEKKCGYKYIEETIEKYSCKMHFPKTIEINKCNKVQKKLIKNYLLQDIAKKVLSEMQKTYDINKIVFEKAKQIVIELQPKINAKMKFISHILYGKLVELYKDTSTTIRFVRAAQKLKAYTGEYIECKLKCAYSKRKWLSIQYTKWFLENKFSEEQKDKWLPFLLGHSKGDDLSDTLLYSINGLFGIPKKTQKMNFKKKNLK